MAITVTLACGCRVEWVDGSELPYCAEHKERRVQQVNSMVPPRIVAYCNAEGPYVVKRET